VARTTYVQSWPEPYIYVYIHRIFGDFQAKNTLCTPYVLANPIYVQQVYERLARKDSPSKISNPEPKP